MTNQPTRQQIRQEQRRVAKRGETVSKEELLRKARRVEPWKRWFFVGLGLFSGGLAYSFYLLDAPRLVWGFLAVCGAVGVLFGLAAGRQSMDNQLESIADRKRPGDPGPLDAL